jgi:tetratricopeptide (TPR) repeat protein
MSQTHRKSFLITLGLIFLLPIFFIPGGALNLDVAKSMFFVLGTITAGLVFLFEIWQRGNLDTPWHLFILTAIFLPLVYLLSALLSTPSALSLLGYNFEVGTFGFMLIGSAFLILVAIIFRDTSRTLQALGALFISVLVVALFVTIKIIFGMTTQAGGGVLVFGNFFGNIGNPIGNWTDLAISFGLLSSLSALVLGMVPMRRSVRIIIYGAFILGTVLLAIVNFSPAFILTLGASVFLIFYFLKMEKHFFNTASISPPASKNFFLQPIFLPIVLTVVSIIFLANPTVSKTSGTLGDTVARVFEVENIDVRPSFSATLGVSKAVLSEKAFIGSGPNTFSRDWLIYKPIDVNTTPFWAVSFPFGVGFIPTQIASTGILGTVMWLIFFTLFIFLGIKSLILIPESRPERFALVTVFLSALFLWIASFLYVPSATILAFAFIFSGLFIASGCISGVVSSRSFSLKESPRKRFASLLLVVVIVLGTVLLGWVAIKKGVSAFHFKKAIDLSNTEGVPLAEIEKKLDSALSAAPTDIHYIALSRINFAQAQVAANSTEGTPEDNMVLFEKALGKSIEAVRSAVITNPGSYQNWISLGIIYSALVPAPLSVEGAYENALFAYSEARKINPNNPELALFLARLEFNHGNIEEARSFIRSSLALKEDYADAYLALVQLEIQEGNIDGAIASAERLSLLTPNNPGIYFELGLLKYSNKDYNGAVGAFSSALTLAPDYANAKYYLGLAFVELGMLGEATGQFEDLLITNPDSIEVKSILERLRVGEGPIR